ncbi:glycosyltransferase family 4 protein [Photobacterium kishitanii]|uniref:glycosyltransferase family 4 protein n=1 Tax=Photobacterium kishitanii TaxID=318456 RepID=UPI000431172F|nr:glycosyltransferase family 4 protein [Photobacterium kishitanii]PSU91832.1 phosphonate ABC transporter substrate-binding protein [Photobacterium kishitanii]PSW59578.1 phosphonate ABC transporter substrate-binding protein [Photobacterium kishitanii]CEO41381.1 Alpha-D-GlcNAc alpha-1,2-L-rhamnosyltransferase [Photobacterium kishitanii]
MNKSILVLGTRGIPNVAGGVESHCQALYPLLVEKYNLDITVTARKPYVPYTKSVYEGVKLVALPAVKNKALEAPLHSLLAAFYAIKTGADIVHIHAIGPGLVTPLLRLFGKKVVFTHHSQNYDHQKWGKLAKFILRLGEKCAMKYASEVIVISDFMQKLMSEKYGRDDTHLIFNGVNKPQLPDQQIIKQYLDRYDLAPRDYVVAVGRFSQEKGLDVLLEAYKRSGIKKKLVLVGDSDQPTAYSDKLKATALATSGVVLTGFLSGEALNSIFSQADTFVLPSFSEGLPIALLEAMSFSLPVVVSDIPANKAVHLADKCYFACGDSQALATLLTTAVNQPLVCYAEYLKKYDWNLIAQQTYDVFLAAENNNG